MKYIWYDHKENSLYTWRALEIFYGFNKIMPMKFLDFPSVSDSEKELETEQRLSDGFGASGLTYTRSCLMSLSKFP